MKPLAPERIADELLNFDFPKTSFGLRRFAFFLGALQMLWFRNNIGFDFFIPTVKTLP